MIDRAELSPRSPENFPILEKPDKLKLAYCCYFKSLETSTMEPMVNSNPHYYF